MPENTSNLENWNVGLLPVNEDILPDCPPAKIDQKDFSKVIGHSKEEIDALNIELAN